MSTSPPAKKSNIDFFDDPIASFLSENDPNQEMELLSQNTTDGIKLVIFYLMSYISYINND